MQTTGVYFVREDYASFSRRVLVDLVDFSIYVALYVVVMLLVVPLWPSQSGADRRQLERFVLAVLAVLYFVVLKRSAFRTPGYRLFKVKIVGLNGQTPGYGALTLRLIFAFFGPINWLLDLIWLSSDPNRQALRDKFANTFVVKASAEPLGIGKVIWRPYEIMFFNFLFREVERQPAI